MNETPQEQAAKAALAKNRDAAQRPESAPGIRAKIAQVQQSVGTIAKNGVNPHFGSHYATLDEVWAQIKPALAEARLAVYCTTSGSGEEWRITTHIADLDTPEEIKGDFPIPAKGSPQQIGSAITYARRYTLCSLLQIVTADEDDDGNAGQGQKRQAAAAPAPAF